LHKNHRGFTIAELIVVTAIILVLTGLLYPVFASAKASARQTACLLNYKQAYVASALYLSDYEDRMMLTNYTIGNANSSNDRTWVQSVLPYAGNAFRIFRCPADDNSRPSPEATFDIDLIPGDTTSPFYQASLRSNIGFNYLYLSPVFKEGSGWVQRPRTTSDIPKPARALQFIDTVYEVVNGQPQGGGSYLVIPPCRFLSDGNTVVDSFLNVSQASAPMVFAANQGWQPNLDSTFKYGQAWPWHNGRMTVVRMDGSAKALTTTQLTEGCDVQDSWQGLIADPLRYLWRGGAL
jgi:prepilin-type N-terminal cleavage/methylation domain-containing protein